MKIRIKFSKQGEMKFIGHLDIMRYFQKAIRRAGVDVRYSEGFSPHQIMSFAAPLSVGLTSNGEYMDIEVLSTGSSEEMVNRLNQVSVDGIRVLSYRVLPEKTANAMSAVAAADYTLQFRPGYEPEDEEGWFQHFAGFLKQPSIPVVKKTKKGEREIDLRPLIYEASLISCPVPEDKIEEKGRKAAPGIFLKLSAGSAANIKPELVLDAYYHSLGKERPEFAFLIQREELYAQLPDEGGDGKDSLRFVPLEALGKEIEKENSFE